MRSQGLNQPKLDHHPNLLGHGQDLLDPVQEKRCRRPFKAGLNSKHDSLRSSVKYFFP